jgi:hypothetical protein
MPVIDIEYEDEQERDDKPTVVAKGKVEKRSLFRTLKEGIFAASPRDVKESIVHDVIFPAMRDFLADTAYTIVDVAIYGRGGSRPSRGRSGRKRSGSGVFDYSKESTRRQEDRDTRTSAGYRLDNIFFETRREADDVFDALVEELEEKGSVSVYYFYEVAGKTALYTDHNYGWTSLEGTRYKRSEDGYALVLPQPEKLKR